jgi:hypothetical protein
MRLRSSELCPIHKSISCCGRELVPKPRLIRLGVQRVEDPHHPRGYRELRKRTPEAVWTRTKVEVMLRMWTHAVVSTWSDDGHLHSVGLRGSSRPSQEP